MMGLLKCCSAKLKLSFAVDWFFCAQPVSQVLELRVGLINTITLQREGVVRSSGKTKLQESHNEVRRSPNIEACNEDTYVKQILDLL